MRENINSGPAFAMHDLLSSKIYVLIIGAAELIREGLFFVVSRLMPNTTIFVASPDELSTLKRVRADLILYLLEPPYLPGVDDLQTLRTRFPDAAMIALSDSKEEYLLVGAAASRTCSFILVSDDVESLGTAISFSLAGKAIYPDGRPLRSLMPVKKLQLPRPRLTPRQMQVYEYLRAGKTNKEIGALLSLSDNTIRSHVSAILRALNVHNRTEASNLDSRLFRRN